MNSERQNDDEDEFPRGMTRESCAELVKWSRQYIPKDYDSRVLARIAAMAPLLGDKAALIETAKRDIEALEIYQIFDIAIIGSALHEMGVFDE